jgi:hypothetical protein
MQSIVLKTRGAIAWRFYHLVAQSFTLLFRRILFWWAPAVRAPWNVSTLCRLQIGDTAECNSALRPLGSSRFGKCEMLVLLCLSSMSFGMAATNRLEIQSVSGRPEIRLPKEPVAPVAGMQYRLKVEASPDLKTWSPAGELAPGTNAAFRLSLNPEASYRFFRLNASVEDTAAAPETAEMFGYGRIYREELLRAGSLTPEQFAARHAPSLDYLPAITFNPESVKFWNDFNADPVAYNASLPTNVTDRRTYDFRMNPAEMKLFLTNGFVVSERLGSFSFADIFYRIFNDDLPVFVSADAVLHAWHYSYQRLLEESEETQLLPTLQSILDGMANELAKQTPAFRNGPLRDSLADADYILTVARSLLFGRQLPAAFGSDTAVTSALASIASFQYVPDPTGFPSFGTTRPQDFSQYRIRGHYERTVGLGRYFQAFMWTSRMDLRIFQKDAPAQSLRELGSAVVLAHLLQASGQSGPWRQLDNLIRLFVGRADAMTFAQLQPLLQAAGINSLEAITSLAPLVKLQQDIVNGNLGTQLYAGDVFYSPFGPEQVQLPRSFVLTGQRFVPDGWALAQVTFDRILWDKEIPGYTVSGKVLRRYTSALDAVYGVLGNRQIGWEIAQRMLDTGSRTNLRDGLPYAHNLSAVAATFDRISPAAWEDSIYTRWLAALRALSAPTTDAKFPQAMRTRAWAMRTLNTQLASYTELKHDTVLYAKQPYASSILCEYPAGFVEPVPEFWRRMKEMAAATADGLALLPVAGFVFVQPPAGTYPDSIHVDLARQQAARISFCTNFVQQMAVLEALATKELQQQPFTQAETDFIRGLMNRRDRDYYGPTFDGWYPGLFYKDYGQFTGPVGTDGSNKSDPVVTDIYTAPPDLIDPKGGALHEATGNVDLMLIAVDNGPDRMMYAGPTMSHYEFIVPGPALQRLADSEWLQKLSAPATKPARPDWTRGYLVPKP